ncbi:MAG: TolC family protein [Deltaproteobacteria bacterium]|nr:TolC family protein [Deltaproteobacteria bacterium]
MRYEYLVIAGLFWMFHLLFISSSVFASQQEDQSRPIETEFAGTVITFDQVKSLVLEHHPELKAAQMDKRIAENLLLQQSFWPNPEIEVEYEDSDEKEVTVELTQLIELGGKRGERIAKAQFMKDSVLKGIEIMRLRTISKAKASFIEVLSAQENLKIDEELTSISNQMYQIATKRVKTGFAPPVEELKANVELQNAQMKLKRASAKLKAAKTNLAKMWGASNVKFQQAAGDFYTVSPVPTFESLFAQIENNPELARWGTEISVRNSEFELEKRNRIPDIEVSGGVKRFVEANNTIYLVGLSLPLPLFDRNYGNIQAARANLSKAKFDKDAMLLELETELKQLYQTLETVVNEIETIQASTLQSAQTAYKLIEKGYQAGEFSYLDVLDTQRNLFEIKINYVQVLSEYHKIIANIELIVGSIPSDTRK